MPWTAPRWTIRADALRAARTRAGRTASLAGRAALAGAIAASGRSRPVEDGHLAVHGPDGRVEVLRDRFGVPHIYAGSERDTLFGQGFVHAQDRLFQMEAMRRAGSGRFSEIAGSVTLGLDRFMRRIGLASIAARDLAACDDAARALLVAYAAGVNEAVRTLSALPPEFAFFGITPEPWHPEHTMLLGRFVLLPFAGNWDTELLREQLLRTVGAERAVAIEPAHPVGVPTTTGLPAPAAARLLAAFMQALERGPGIGAASNAWAVSGARTETGAPLLASDPHLESRMPGLLHVSHVVGGRFDVIGAGVAGIPLVAMGHNREVAWGITAGLADVSDCVVETVDPADPTRYLAPDGWRTGRTRIERIAVRDAETVEEQVLETRHGPVIGPVLPGETRVIALRSTALEAGDPLGPLLDLARAHSVEEADAAIARRPGATFNYVFASRSGRIGYRMSGTIPRRAHGEGLLPRPGAEAPDRVTSIGGSGLPDALTPAEMPHRLDPPEGVIVSANQAPGGPIELGEDWCEPWRAERIRALLAARARHTIGSFASIQTDTRSELLLRLRALLDAAEVLDGELRALLAAWDGQLSADSAAAALLEQLLREAARLLAPRAAGDASDILLGAGLGLPLTTSSFAFRGQGWVVAALEAAMPPWCDDEHDRDLVLRVATQRAVAALQARLGKRPQDWRWGAMHQWHLPHPLEAVPGLGRWFSRGPFPFPGDQNTVLQGSSSMAHDAAAVAILPGYRQIIDLADFDRSVFQLSTGNSGIPGHARYGDCIPEFLAGRYRPLLYSRAAIEADREHTLELEPSSPRSA